MRRMISGVVSLLAVLVSLVGAGSGARADAVVSDAFWRTWARDDLIVTDGGGPRTWMWGPSAISGEMTEFYAESEPYGVRTVQYFDKSRMEITHPTASQDSEWYVTNGLLVVELITGMRQVGDSEFEESIPADEPVAGDPDDDRGPTYASFAGLLQSSAPAAETAVTRFIQRDGTVTTDARYAAYAIGTTAFNETTHHWIALPFWQFMTSSGDIWVDGQITVGPLFENPYYATGLPIVDPYWASVKVAGTYRDVLIQCFERRCLTYTPDNPPAWQVEAGNVGQHYYRWLYGQVPAQPTGTVAFIKDTNGGSEIYTIQADGASEHFIGDGQSPSLSPDGTRIAWAGPTLDGSFDIFVANVDGTGATNISNRPGYDADPAWDPSGQWIAFTSDREGNDIAIWVMRPDGTDVRRVSAGDHAYSPVWSPDGTKIAFWDTADPVGRFSGIHVVNADGTGEVSAVWCAGSFSWTPDSQSLIGTPGYYVGCSEVGTFIVNADGSNLRHLELNITEGLSYNDNLSFSPDGTKAAFTILIEGNEEIYIANADFTDIHRLTTSDGADTGPIWSPDSRWVGWTSQRDGHGEVYLADTQNEYPVHRLTRDAAGDLLVDWE